MVHILFMLFMCVYCVSLQRVYDDVKRQSVYHIKFLSGVRQVC